MIIYKIITSIYKTAFTKQTKTKGTIKKIIMGLAPNTRNI